MIDSVSHADLYTPNRELAYRIMGSIFLHEDDDMLDIFERTRNDRGACQERRKDGSEEKTHDEGVILDEGMKLEDRRRSEYLRRGRYRKKETFSLSSSFEG